MSDRAKGAIVGCLACDAAATGVQWIYDLDTLAQLQKQREMVRALPELCLRVWTGPYFSSFLIVPIALAAHVPVQHSCSQC